MIDESNWVIDPKDILGINKVHRDCIKCEYFHHGCTRTTIKKYDGACWKDKGISESKCRELPPCSKPRIDLNEKE